MQFPDCYVHYASMWFKKDEPHRDIGKLFFLFSIPLIIAEKSADFRGFRFWSHFLVKKSASISAANLWKSTGTL
ncbi:hypothetical protein [uncultured Algoriphagus sp.]|uniref:hypothetical protein n=1 Tax=uncultured Algoriphagus sp. TaxID=417365 RepID=UPI002599B34A|nr:hypothetical protein [uncultured Algoriphagus sp.]